MLRKAGFNERNARGSHTRWVHSTFRDLYVTISGQDGADAKPYQEEQVGDAIQSATKRLGSKKAMNERDVPKYSMTIEWSPEDDVFVVTIPELPGCRTHGESYEEAAGNGREVIELVVEGLAQDGQHIPEALCFQSGDLVELRSHRDRKTARRAS